jgi:hypothetical protein
MPDKAIAGMLNRTGKRTGRLNGWTQSRVRGFRNTHGIAVYVEGEWAARGEVTLTEAARMLDLSPMTVLRWHYSCRAVLQRRALGDQATGPREPATRQDGAQGSIIIKSRSADPYLSMM